MDVSLPRITGPDSFSGLAREDEEEMRNGSDAKSMSDFVLKEKEMMWELLSLLPPEDGYDLRIQSDFVRRNLEDIWRYLHGEILDFGEKLFMFQKTLALYGADDFVRNCKLEELQDVVNSLTKDYKDITKDLTSHLLQFRKDLAIIESRFQRPLARDCPDAFGALITHYLFKRQNTLRREALVKIVSETDYASVKEKFEHFVDLCQSRFLEEKMTTSQALSKIGKKIRETTRVPKTSYFIMTRSAGFGITCRSHPNFMNRMFHAHPLKLVTVGRRALAH